MKVGKPKSKRVSVRLRHKIEKASNSKQRKLRKEAKKNPQWRSRLKKDPGIPNLFPYKDKVLAEIEDSRRRKEEEAQKRRDIARAQRLGTSATDMDRIASTNVEEEDEDEDLIDPEELSEDGEEGDSMDVEESSSSRNPMAALLASAQIRAHNYTQPEDEDDDSDIVSNDNTPDSKEWTGLKPDKTTTAPPTQGPRQTQPTHRPLPQRALDDPIKTVSTLLTRLVSTTDGIQQIITHYTLPPLVLDGSEATNTRFLVEVARKRGRLGRGGVPNLHAAALTVLGDLNDERLKLPALAQGGGVGTKTTATATLSVPAVVNGGVETSAGAGEVRIVQTLAEPFRIEGLFGDD